MSRGDSPVTQTADVARKQASIGLMLWPSAQLAGRPSSADPATITARNDNTGQVKGLKKRFFAIACLCQPEQVNARSGGTGFTAEAVERICTTSARGAADRKVRRLRVGQTQTL